MPRPSSSSWQTWPDRARPAKGACVRGFAWLIFSVLMAITAGPAWAALSELQSQRAQVQAQREALQQRVRALQQEIERSESQRADVRERLRTVETAISERARSLEALNRQFEDSQAQLQRWQAEQAEQSAHKEALEQRLAAQLRTQYASGLSPWASLLSGKNPQDIQRELHYLGYVAEQRAEEVQALNELLVQIDALRAQARNTQQQVQEIQEQTRAEQSALEAELDQHEQLLDEVESELAAQRGQVAQYQADDERLSRLIEGIEGQIRSQREAERKAAREAERAARERIEQAREDARQAQQEAEQARQQAEQARREADEAREQLQLARQLKLDKQALSHQEHTLEQLQDKARRAAKRAEQARAEAVPEPEPEADSQATAVMLQGLPKGAAMPAQGSIQGRFGTERAEGGTWRGVVIRNDEGTPARAIADGEVVFAGWLSGFGNLLIIDHGQGYLTVYGYNQSLLKEVGDQVRAGDTVTRIGATGGQVESGLYFEIRHQGQPVNPLLWLQAP